jgi:hypothetical protein
MMTGTAATLAREPYPQLPKHVPDPPGAARHFSQITQCRASGSRHLVPVLNLGNQALTGVFPKSAVEPVTAGPLELVWCPESGLLQLNHSYNPSEIYG